MDRKLFRSILLIITYAVLLVMALVRLEALGNGAVFLLKLLEPLLLGFVIAFILDRPCQLFYRLYDRRLKKSAAGRLARPLAVGTAYLALILVLVGLVSFVTPKLVESIQTFMGSLTLYTENLQAWLNQLLEYLKLDALDLSRLSNTLKELLGQALSFLSDFGPHLLEFTSGLVSMVVTLVLALVFSIYMLSGKERLLGQCRRVLRAYVPEAVAAPILDVVHLTAGTFAKFVSGQLIEACILGGLCALGMLFIQADYAPLIGVVIGFSALIPVAGAYAGAILSALLLVMVSPLKAVTFLIFLVILQQVEGNVIYPRVVGASIGLPGIWVLAAVTVGGGLLGLPGILFSVPVASVLYTLLRRDVRRRLERPQDRRRSNNA